jgi:NitT/TauT family transport system substrate-binding protein
MSESSCLVRFLTAVLGVVAAAFQVLAWAQPAATDASLRLDFSINGKHAPFLLGVEKGFYSEQGIKLRVEEGRGSLAAVQLVANKSDTFGFADTSSMITVAASGAPVTSVGVIFQRSPVAAISLKPLKEPTDLYGLTIGSTPVGVGSMWEAFLSRNNLDRSKMTVITMDGPGMLPALLQGRADAIIGLVNSEGAAASILAGKEPHVLSFADFGANALAHGIVVHRDTVTQQPDLIRRFMAATVRSWQYAIANRAEAVAALMKRYPDAKSEVVARQLERTIPLLRIGKSNQPIGFVTDADAKATLDLLEKFAGLKSRPSAQSVFTNAFLPTNQK